MNTVLGLPARERLAWGRELGRRFPDELRLAEADGVRVDAWQFDELVVELAGRKNPAPKRIDAFAKPAFHRWRNVRSAGGK